ncbi:MAG: hypothetical protein ACLSB9_17070 [Hydrogeniiclostridium mannosilyticum]
MFGQRLLRKHFQKQALG